MTARDYVQAQLCALREELSPVPGLYDMFCQCFMNTLATTVKSQGEGDTFIITGDIEAMWLRDSTAQVLHYVRFAGEPSVARLILGLIARQTECILIDPYANAFNATDSGRRWTDDLPAHSGWVWERKYEIDSLCYPLLLAWRYHEQTGDGSFLTQRFHKALCAIAEVFATEQDHAHSPYYFIRENCPPQDTLSHGGKGAPVAVTGMTFSGFRPSDDACTYGYLIPSNLFAAQALTYAEAFARMLQDEALAGKMAALREDIRRGLAQYATVEHPEFGKIYAYETDGLGHYVLMDDANVPSLLSLPYLSVCGADDAQYKRTRAFVLSRENPYYYEGAYARGVGSPHTPKGYVWPIALCMQAMTATEDAEVAGLLKALLATHAGTGFMHESFDPDDPGKFTRSWFAWANSLFGELIWRLHEQGRLSAVLALMPA